MNSRRGKGGGANIAYVLLFVNGICQVRCQVNGQAEVRIAMAIEVEEEGFLQSRTQLEKNNRSTHLKDDLVDCHVHSLEFS